MLPAALAIVVPSRVSVLQPAYAGPLPKTALLPSQPLCAGRVGNQDSASFQDDKPLAIPLARNALS